MLTSSEARGIASALWGKVNNTYRTNTKGGFAYSCEGHGGFIVSADSVNHHSWIEKYVSKQSAIRYTNERTGKSSLMHPYRTRSTRMTYTKTETVEFFVFEEDCDFSVAVILGVNLLKNRISMESARDSFWAWHDEENPVVQNRIEIDRKRKEGDDDLIVSALRQDDGNTLVWTASNDKYIVSGYGDSRDQYGTPYLSNCEILERVHAA